MQDTIAPSVERRRWGRRKKLLPVLIADSQETLESPERVWMMDSSPGGIRLQVKREVEEGHVLMVRPTLASSSCPWISVLVKSVCVREDDHAELGCEFVHSCWETYLVFA